MADIPQDPRQLARDILSGKIKLEDLQREQQRRQAGMQKPAARPAEDKPVPLPNFERRQPPAAPANQQPVEAVPLPSRQPSAPRQQQRPQQRPQQKKFPKAPPKPVRPMPPSEPVVPEPAARRPDQAAATVANIARDEADAIRKVVRTAIKQKQSLRQAILMSEILRPPVALRDER